MGIFFDLMQQSMLDDQQKQTNSIENRVEYLEKELIETRILLRKTLEALEDHLGEDIDGDGHTG